MPLKNIDPDVAEEWMLLADQADMCSPFSVREWLELWSEAFAEFGSGNVIVIMARSRNKDRLVGVLCVYHRLPGFGLAGVLRRLENAGNAWRSSSIFQSYSSSFLTVTEKRDDVVVAILDYLHGMDWKSVVLNCISERSKMIDVLRSWSQNKGLSYREADHADGYVIDTRRDFAEYLGTRTASLRRKIYHERNKGQFSRELVSSREASLEIPLQVLWQLHQIRWKSKGMSEKCYGLIKSFSRSRSSRTPLEVSILSKEGSPISAIVFVRYQNTLYFLQSGFRPIQGFSPLLLHFGFEIEASFEDANVNMIDLLPAPSVEPNYKARLGSSRYGVKTIQISRSMTGLCVDRFTWPIYK